MARKIINSITAWFFGPERQFYLNTDEGKCTAKAEVVNGAIRVYSDTFKGPDGAPLSQERADELVRLAQDYLEKHPEEQPLEFMPSPTSPT